MEGPPTPLALPPHLPYPIRVARVVAAPGAEVQRGSRLLEYTYTSPDARRALQQLAAGAIKELPDGVREDDMAGSWDCPVDGCVDSWDGIGVGSRIDARRAREAVVSVQEPCSHPVQVNGMCAVCGKVFEQCVKIRGRADGRMDYMAGPADAGPSRFPGSFEMGHDAMGVTVSGSVRPICGSTDGRKPRGWIRKSGTSSCARAACRSSSTWTRPSSTPPSTRPSASGSARCTTGTS
jgi:RNA polymerase II subunit A-like phosphatase